MNLMALHLMAKGFKETTVLKSPSDLLASLEALPFFLCKFNYQSHLAREPEPINNGYIMDGTFLSWFTPSY